MKELTCSWLDTKDIYIGPQRLFRSLLIVLFLKCLYCKNLYEVDPLLKFIVEFHSTSISSSSDDSGALNPSVPSTSRIRDKMEYTIPNNLQEAENMERIATVKKEQEEEEEIKILISKAKNAYEDILSYKAMVNSLHNNRKKLKKGLLKMHTDAKLKFSKSRVAAGCDEYAKTLLVLKNLDILSLRKIVELEVKTYNASVTHNEITQELYKLRKTIDVDYIFTLNNVLKISDAAQTKQISEILKLNVVDDRVVNIQKSSSLIIKFAYILFNLTTAPFYYIYGRIFNN